MALKAEKDYGCPIVLLVNLLCHLETRSNPTMKQIHWVVFREKKKDNQASLYVLCMNAFARSCAKYRETDSTANKHVFLVVEYKSCTRPVLKKQRGKKNLYAFFPPKTNVRSSPTAAAANHKNHIEAYKAKGRGGQGHFEKSAF